MNTDQRDVGAVPSYWNFRKLPPELYRPAVSYSTNVTDKLLSTTTKHSGERERMIEAVVLLVGKLHKMGACSVEGGEAVLHWQRVADLHKLADCFHTGMFLMSVVPEESVTTELIKKVAGWGLSLLPVEYRTPENIMSALVRSPHEWVHVPKEHVVACEELFLKRYSHSKWPDNVWNRAVQNSAVFGDFSITLEALQRGRVTLSQVPKITRELAEVGALLCPQEALKDARMHAHLDERLVELAVASAENNYTVLEGLGSLPHALLSDSVLRIACAKVRDSLGLVLKRKPRSLAHVLRYAYGDVASALQRWEVLKSVLSVSLKGTDDEKCRECAKEVRQGNVVGPLIAKFGVVGLELSVALAHDADVIGDAELDVIVAAIRAEHRTVGNVTCERVLSLLSEEELSTYFAL